MAAAVACDGCGKKFAWSPQFAGKKLKCKCGSVITIPADEPRMAASGASAPSGAPPKQAAPAAAKASPDGKSRTAPPLPKKKSAPPPKPVTPRDEPILEISEDEGPMLEIVEPVVAMAGGGAAVLACPSCNSPLSPGAILCVGCGYNLQLRRKMIAAPTKVVSDDRYGGDSGVDTSYTVREKIAPPIIMVLGYLLWVSFMAAGWQAESDAALFSIAVTVAIMTAFATLFMTAGCFIAAKLLDTNFGALPTAIVKLAATYLLANGVTEMLTYFMGGFGAFMIYTSVGYGIYWIMLMWLFELDGFEVWVTASIFMLLQIGAFFAFMIILMNIGFGGMAAGMGGGSMPMGGAGEGEYEMYEDGEYGDGDDMMEDEGFDPQVQDPEAVTPPAEVAPTPEASPDAAPTPAPDGAPAPDTTSPLLETAPAPVPGSSSRARGEWPWALAARQLLTGFTCPAAA